MKTRLRMIACALATAAVAGTSACRVAGAGPAPLAAGDTVRGIVSLVGSEPHAVLVVSPRRGDVVVPHGVDVALLRALTGLEVTLAGSMTDECVPEGGPRGARVFDVTQFAVRSMNGMRAVDGTLVRDGETWQLATSDGQKLAIPVLPEMLKQHEGARVYFVGALDGVISAYGVIKAAPR